MNRNIKGGFLTLSGVVGIVGMIIVAMQNPSTSWVTPPGRMIVSILENGVLIPSVFFLVLFVVVLLVSFQILASRDETSCIAWI